MELDCETLPSDLFPWEQSSRQGFQQRGGATSGDIIRQGADGRGGRATILCPANLTTQPALKVLALYCASAGFCCLLYRVVACSNTYLYGFEGILICSQLLHTLQACTNIYSCQTYEQGLRKYLVMKTLAAFVLVHLPGTGTSCQI